MLITEINENNICGKIRKESYFNQQDTFYSVSVAAAGVPAYYGEFRNIAGAVKNLNAMFHLTMKNIRE